MIINILLNLDFESSEGEEIEEALPRVGRKKKRDDSDSGSDVSYIHKYISSQF